MKKAMIAVLFLMMASTGYAADFYLKPHNGVPCTPSTCNGQQATPWRFAGNESRVGAVDQSAMSPGDTLYVCGVHDGRNGFIVITEPDLTISGDCPGDRGRLKYLNARDDADGLTIEDIELWNDRPDARSGGQSVGLVGTDDVIIRRVHTKWHTKGIFCSRDVPCDNLLIEDSLIELAGQGIQLFSRSGQSEQDGLVIRNNTIRDIGRSLVGGDGEAIGLQGYEDVQIYGNHIVKVHIGINMWIGGPSYIRDVTIQGNLIENVRGAPCTWPSRAIMRSNTVTGANQFKDIRIRGNIINNVGGEAVRMTAAAGAPGNVIEGNTINGFGRDCGNNAITTSGPWSVANNIAE